MQKVTLDLQQETVEFGSYVDPFVLYLFAALAQKERALISARTREGLRAAKARGARLGGWTAGSEASKRQADELAERRMRPILIEILHLPSARQSRQSSTAAGLRARPAENGRRKRSFGLWVD